MYETRAEFLKDTASRKGNDLVRLSVRELVAFWGAKRRGYWIADKVKRDLRDAGLASVPDFTDGWIDRQQDHSGSDREYSATSDTEPDP